MGAKGVEVVMLDPAECTVTCGTCLRRVEVVQKKHQEPE